MKLNPKQKYRLFLKTEFWIALSSAKKILNPACERCSGLNRVQAHHKFYRPDWFETKIGDLETLCRDCHRKEHGIESLQSQRIMVYRGDIRFSRFIHWTMYLRGRMCRLAKGLKRREEWYLKMAMAAYPEKKKDSCMKFHVGETLKMSGRAESFK